MQRWRGLRRGVRLAIDVGAVFVLLATVRVYWMLLTPPPVPSEPPPCPSMSGRAHAEDVAVARCWWDASRRSIETCADQMGLVDVGAGERPVVEPDAMDLGGVVRTSNGVRVAALCIEDAIEGVPGLDFSPAVTYAVLEDLTGSDLTCYLMLEHITMYSALSWSERLGWECLERQVDQDLDGDGDIGG